MNRIVIYTSVFPFGTASETFLSTELRVAADEGYDITLVPVTKVANKREVPASVVVDASLCEVSFLVKVFAFLRSFVFLPYVRGKDMKFSGRGFVDTIKYLYAASLVYTDLCRRADDSTSTVFYSYWLSYPPIAFARYKNNHPLCKSSFVSRGHGSDVYAKELGVYYPLRDYLMKGLDRVFVVSEFGKHFLCDKYPEYAQKIRLSRLGVMKPSCLSYKHKQHVFCVVSCASVIGLKRIDLLFRSLNAFVKDTGVKIEWHHFGSGPLFDKIQELTREHNPDLCCVLHGTVDNSVILDYYEDNQVDCLISVSESEGIPVSMMEAISYGIPVLATDVGGVSEIVTSQTGRLINKNYTQTEFNNQLMYVLENVQEYSKTAISFFEENYNAEKNYKLFYKEISSIF